MLARDIIESAAWALHDFDPVTGDGYVRWPQAQLLRFLNMAQLQVVKLAPEASSAFVAMQLAAGARQTIPATALRLLTVTRNMGSTGFIPGRHVSLTDRATLDGQLATWGVSGEAVTEIESYVYDDRVPKTFYVYPPLAAEDVVWVELGVSAKPAVCTAVTDTLTIEDTYFSPLLHWVLYLALCLELDDSSSSAKALHHYQCFSLELGQDLTAASLTVPNLSELYLANKGAPTNG